MLWWRGDRKILAIPPCTRWRPDDRLSEGVLRFRAVYNLRSPFVPVGRAGCTLLGVWEVMPIGS